MASRKNQEIRGGVLEDFFEEGWHATNTDKTSVMAFRAIHDNKQGQCVFDEKGNECWGTCSGQWKKRTIRQRKRDIDHLTAWPWPEVADPVLVEREVGKFRCFQSSGFKFASKGRAGDHTRVQQIINQIGYPKGSLYETHKIQAGGDPSILPRDHVHPECVIGDWYRIAGRCD